MFFTFLKFIFIFVYNAPEINVTRDLVALLQQDIALVFLGRFRCGLQRFFGEEKPFPAKETDLEISARRRYHTCRNARENCHSPRKWVQSLCAPLRPFKNEMKENSYHSILPHALLMCTRIKIFCYLVTGCHQNQKLSSS